MRWIGWITVCYALVVPIIKPLEALFAFLLLLMTLCLFFMKEKTDSSIHNYGLIILFYFVGNWISVVFQGDIAEDILFALKTSSIFIVFLLATYLRDTSKINLSILAYCLSTVVIAVISAIQYLCLGVMRPPTMMSAIHAGYIFDYALLILVIYAVYSRGYMRLVTLVAALIIIFTLIVNASRGAWIAIFAPLMVFAIFLSSLNRKLILFGIFIALCFFISLPITQSRYEDAYKDVAIYQLDRSIETSLGTRFEMWRTSFEMWRKAPVWGVGPGNWQKEVQRMIQANQAYKYIGEYNQPHNMYLNALSTTGLVGLFSLLFLVCFPIYFAWNSGLGHSFYSDALFVVSIAILVQGLTDSVPQMYRPFQSGLFLLGLLMAGIRQNEMNSAHLPS